MARLWRLDWKLTDRLIHVWPVRTEAPNDKLERYQLLLSRDEQATELMALPEQQRQHTFFLCWTRKEAYIKAIGDGLSAPLDDFRITLNPGHLARFVHISRDVGATALWTQHNLEIAEDFAGALAYRDRLRPVDVFPAADATDLLGAFGDA